MYKFSSVPMSVFHTWYQEMINEGNAVEPSAMVLATCDTSNRPSARVVLLKKYTDEGFEFFTNFKSRKGVEIEKNPFVALVFDWRSIYKQVRVEGRAVFIAAVESDAYHASRSRESQISAFCSKQSKVLENRESLLAEFELAKKQFEGMEVPRPKHWGGIRVVPHAIEFWQGFEHRLHDRKRYTKNSDGVWCHEALYP